MSEQAITLTPKTIGPELAAELRDLGELVGGEDPRRYRLLDARAGADVFEILFDAERERGAARAGRGRWEWTDAASELDVAERFAGVDGKSMRN